MLGRKAFWWSFAAIGLLGAGACVQLRHSSRLSVRHSFPDIVADGREHVIAELDATHLQEIEGGEVTLTGKGSETLSTTPAGNGNLFISQRAPVNPIAEHFRARWRGQTVDIPVSFAPDTAAAILSPGLPDWMPLRSAEDRGNFRRWFTELAERAADAPASELPPEIADCAALLRYSFRESLRAHNDRWYADAPAVERVTAPSVAQWNYPNTPLSAGLFRTRPGIFTASDATDGTFAQFADAKTLVAANAFFVSRDLGRARPGDLIFYRLLELDSHHHSQYHSMIVTGAHAEWVVYHTGPSNAPTGAPDGTQTKGEMRRVLLRDLLRHPDPRWRPEPRNANFLGVYRWDILAEDN